MPAIAGFLIALFVVSGPMGHSGRTGELKSLDGKRISVEVMEAVVVSTMEKAGIPGLSCAIINGSKVAMYDTREQSVEFNRRLTTGHTGPEPDLIKSLTGTIRKKDKADISASELKPEEIIPFSDEEMKDF